MMMKENMGKSTKALSPKSSAGDDVSNFPATLKIGPFLYEIRQSVSFAARHSAWGEARPAELVIELEQDLDDGQKTQVLFHEFLHAANEHYRLGISKDDEEDVIDRIATVFYAMLSENNLLRR